jgi:hypothetical protein
MCVLPPLGAAPENETPEHARPRPAEPSQKPRYAAMNIKSHDNPEEE